MSWPAIPRPSHPADAPRLAELISAVVEPLAISRWLVPDDHDRAAILPAYAAVLVDHALTHGEIDLTLAGDGAALWLPGSAVAPTDYQARLAAACGPYLPRFQALDAVLSAERPVVASHSYLAVLAVHPRQQRRGLGATLLTHRLEQLDRHATPVYLEAPSDAARTFYLRYGFVAVPGAPVRLPDAGPALWPMWRNPRAPVRVGRAALPRSPNSPAARSPDHPQATVLNRLSTFDIRGSLR